MSKILDRIHKVDPNDSDAVRDAVTTFCNNLRNCTGTDCQRWLRALDDVINRFPKFCGTHRSNIEKYVAIFLNSNNYHNVIEAGKCAQTLQQVKPSQDKAATPKACWREQMHLLCNAAHILLENLFPNLSDVNKKSKDPEVQDTQLLSKTPLTLALRNIDKMKKANMDMAQNKMNAVFIRLRNIFVFIQAMLVETFPVAKPIRPQVVLEVILQAVSVSDKENQAGVENIIGVKTEALKTLDALVACLGANLVPFSPLVFRFIMQTLRWSSENDTKEYEKVRIAAYGSLIRWLRVLHVYKPSHEGRGKLWEDELTEHIISDITPHKPVVELNVNAVIPTKNLSKKARRKLANSMLKESTMAVHMPGEKKRINVSEELSDELAVAALKCAETLFTACGIFLKPATHKVFHERLVRECFALESHSVKRALSLLRALEAARRGVPPGVPPPTSYCLDLYSRLLTHHMEISRFCSQALLDIRLQLHCSPPSLNFALEVQPETTKKIEKKKKTISKRNRAMLESLLGAERMPAEDEDVDIINVDEPMSKRPRQESDLEKISLSSASVKSIHGSYDSDVQDNVDESDRAVKSISSEGDNNYDIETIVDITPQNETEMSQDVTDRIESNIVEAIEDDIENISSNIDKTDAIEPINNESNDTLQSKVDDSTVLKQVTDLEGIISEIVDGGKSEATIKDLEKQLPQSTTHNSVTEQTTTDMVVIDECLPNTNETDDSELASGQTYMNSQIAEPNIEKEEQTLDEENKQDNDIPKENRISISAKKICENGDDVGDAESTPSKTTEKNDNLSIEDMLADFVDEVIEDSKIQA